MNNHGESLTAVDVIRCAYLAHLAENRGDTESAARWQAKVDAWLESRQSTARPNPLGNPGQLAPGPPTDLQTTHAT